MMSHELEQLQGEITKRETIKLVAKKINLFDGDDFEIATRTNQELTDAIRNADAAANQLLNGFLQAFDECQRRAGAPFGEESVMRKHAARKALADHFKTKK